MLTRDAIKIVSSDAPVRERLANHEAIVNLLNARPDLYFSRTRDRRWIIDTPGGRQVFRPNEWIVLNEHGVYRAQAVTAIELEEGDKIVGVAPAGPGGGQDVWSAVGTLARQPEPSGTYFRLVWDPALTEPPHLVVGDMSIPGEQPVWKVIDSPQPGDLVIETIQGEPFVYTQPEEG